MRRNSIDKVLRRVFITSGILQFSVFFTFSQTDSVNVEQIFYYPNGNIASVGEMKEGKPNGSWRSFYPNGTIKSKGNWKNGILDGEWQFFLADGSKQKVLYYLNGNKQGLCTEYKLVYDKGRYKETPQSKEIFDNGIRIGKGFYYNSKGCLQKIIPFKNGEFDGKGIVLDCDSNFVEINHYREGQLVESYKINQLDSIGNKQGKWLNFDHFFEITEEINYKNGIKHGWHRKYLPNGDIEFSILFEEGEMHLSQSTIGFDYMEYSDTTGNVFGGTFFHNTPIGIHIKLDSLTVSDCIEYNTEGKIIGKGKCNKNAKREGMWENNDEYGNIISLGNYSKDARNGKWQFLYRNGQIEQEGNYVSGKEHGLWKWYFLNGQERKIENYHYGSLEGKYQENDSLGNVTVKGFFAENQEEGEWEVRLGNVIWKGIYNFGELNGRVESFYQNGNRYFEGSFISGFQEGRHKYYYENGELREEEIWDMGERIGTWRKYDFLGNQIISITYRNGEEYLINGVKVRY